MLLQDSFLRRLWLILVAGTLASGCDEKTPDNVNTPTNRAKRTRELEERLAQKKPHAFKSGGSGVQDFNSMRAERDSKRKEAEALQERLQIAKISFTSEHPPEGVSVQGLSSPEPWGSWSVGDKVTLRFDNTLPVRFKLQVTARAYGPNVGKPISLVLGEQKQSMIFRQFDSSQTLEVNLKTPIDTLTFEVPKPTSPAEMKESADDRKLGIGLVNILLLRISP